MFLIRGGGVLNGRDLSGRPPFYCNSCKKWKRMCCDLRMIWLENSKHSFVPFQCHWLESIQHLILCEVSDAYCTSDQLWWRKSSPTQINFGLHVCQSLTPLFLASSTHNVSNCELLQFSLKLHAVNQIPAKMLSITRKWMKLCHECSIKTTFLQAMKIRWLKASLAKHSLQSIHWNWNLNKSWKW